MENELQKSEEGPDNEIYQKSLIAKLKKLSHSKSPGHYKIMDSGSKS